MKRAGRMTITNIKTEKIRGPEIEEPDLSARTGENQPGNTDKSLLAELMLGMQLRDCLSSQERYLWSKLAPSDRTIFLVRGGRFVHPEKFDTFPLEHIGGAGGDQALFSHRFHSEGDRGVQAGTIQTALLNSGDPDPLIFGWFGPEMTSLDGDWDYRFSRLVADLRLAWSESSPLAHRLQAHLSTSTPTLIVDQGTGRLLCVNGAAADLCGQKASAMVDLRFEKVRTMLCRTLTNRRLAMKRISAGDINITIVTLVEVEAMAHTTTGFMADFLVHPSQQKLAGIIMAADLLRNSQSESCDVEGVELSDIIAAEARDLYDLTSKQLLLLDDIADNASHSSLVAQTELAINRVNEGRAVSRDVVIQDTTSGRQVSAPGDAFAALAEAVLRAHSIDQENCYTTTVTFEPDENSDKTMIRFETDSTATRGGDSDLWLEYAHRLAIKLGFEQFSHELIGDKLISTEMTSNPHKILETQ